MKNVSNKYKTIAESLDGSARYYHQILVDGVELTDTIVEFKYSHTCNNSTNFSVGNTASAMVEFKIDEPSINLENKEIQVNQGLKLADGSMEYVKLGKFKVLSPEIERFQANYQCVDAMTYKMATVYESVLTYPTTDIAILEEICQQAGIELVNDNLVAHTIDKKLDNYTKREIIGFISQLQGKNAIINTDGKLELIWYTQTDYVVDDNRIYSDRTDIIKNENDYVLGYIKSTYGSKEIVSGDIDTQGIRITNPYMTQDILDEVFNKIKGLIFRAINVDFYGDFRLEVGDIVTVNTNNESYVVPIMTLEQSSDGGVITSIESIGETSTQNTVDTNGGILNEIKRSVVNSETARAIAEQSADKINFIVEGDSVSEFSITDKALNIISENINLTGKVTFNSLDSSVQNILQETKKTVKSITMHYLATTASSGVTTSTSGWTTTVQQINATKKCLWTYQTINYVDNTTTDTKPVISGVYGNTGNKGDKGDTGDTGATGTGVSNVIPLYYLKSNTTAPSAPTSAVISASTASGVWTKSVPKYVNNYTYFTCTQTQYTDDTYGWSTVVIDNGLTNANTNATNALDTINSLEVGGTNLLPDTNVNTLNAVAGDVSRYWSDSSMANHVSCEFIELTDSPVKGLKYGVRQTSLATSGGNNGRNLTWRAEEKIELIDGEEYTLSCYARIISGTQARLRFRFYNSGNQTYLINITNTVWKRISQTIKVNKTTWGGDYCYIGCGGLCDTYAATVELCGFKLEKGNKATDWTPAPEDINTNIDIVSDKANSVDSTLSSLCILEENKTVIDGSKIYTGEVTAYKIAANSIDVDNLFAQTITATGSITGAKLYGASGEFEGDISSYGTLTLYTGYVKNLPDGKQQYIKDAGKIEIKVSGDSNVQGVAPSRVYINIDSHSDDNHTAILRLTKKNGVVLSEENEDGENGTYIQFGALGVGNNSRLSVKPNFKYKESDTFETVEVYNTPHIQRIMIDKIAAGVAYLEKLISAKDITTSLLTIKNIATALADGAVQNMLGVQYKDASENTFTTYPIRVIGSNQTSPYNAGILLGSNNGTTVIGAGESSGNMPKAIGAYNNENLYFIADGKLEIYTGCSNDATSYKKALVIGTDGNATFLNKVAAVTFDGTATKIQGNYVKPTDKETWYAIPFYSGGNTTGSKALSSNEGCSIGVHVGTADTEGRMTIVLGNKIASGTADNMRGCLRLYDKNANYANLYFGNGNTTASRNIYLPDAGGTLALNTPASPSADGLMPSADKTKMNAIGTYLSTAPDGVSFAAQSGSTGTKLASLKLPAGTYVVTCAAHFPTSSRASVLGTYRRATLDKTSGKINDSRGYSAIAAPVYGQTTMLQISNIIVVSSETTYYLNGQTDSTEPEVITGLIKAVRIG